jgi:hypothetical protein
VVRVNRNGNGLDPRVAVNGSVILPDLPTGSHLVRLLDIAANCTVNGANPLRVTIQVNRVAKAAFQIQCAEPVGALRVSTMTSGLFTDPDGYSLSLTSPQRQYSVTGNVGVNDSTTFGDLPTGQYQVSLGGLAPGCASLPAGDLRVVSVVPTDTTRVSFQVSCGNVGAIEVTTVGGGPLPGYPGGYTVTLDGGRDQHIGPNATIRFTLVPVGTHTVALSGVPHWCGVPDGPFPSLGPVLPQTVTVPVGGVTRVVFEVFCIG